MMTPLNRIIRVVRHFTPEVWGWEHELWAQAITPGGAQFYRRKLIIELPCPKREKVSKASELALLEAVGELLSPLSLDPDCAGRRWRALHYCPHGPIGQYHWRWAAVWARCVRRGEKPVHEGWAMAGNEAGRDGSLYLDPVRRAEWDIGYLLGCSWRGNYAERGALGLHSRGTLRQWLKAQEARISGI